MIEIEKNIRKMKDSIDFEIPNNPRILKLEVRINT
jgi:hypothetical protein